MPTHHESSSIQHCIVTAAINHMINPVQKIFFQILLLQRCKIIFGMRPARRKDRLINLKMFLKNISVTFPDAYFLLVFVVLDNRRSIFLFLNQ